MEIVEYMIVNALGQQNVVRAVTEKTAESPQWRIHSIVPTGLKVISNPIQLKDEAIMTFMVIFERPHLGVQA